MDHRSTTFGRELASVVGLWPQQSRTSITNKCQCFLVLPGSENGELVLVLTVLLGESCLGGALRTHHLDVVLMQVARCRTAVPVAINFLARRLGQRLRFGRVF